MLLVHLGGAALSADFRHLSIWCVRALGVVAYDNASCSITGDENPVYPSYSPHFDPSPTDRQDEDGDEEEGEGDGEDGEEMSGSEMEQDAESGEEEEAYSDMEDDEQEEVCVCLSESD